MNKMHLKERLILTIGYKNDLYNPMKASAISQ